MSNSALFDLSGKVAVVKGAGSGLSVEFATVLAAAGADVSCLEVRPDAAQRTVEIVQGLGRKSIALGCDVSVEPEVQTASPTHKHLSAAWTSSSTTPV